MIPWTHKYLPKKDSEVVGQVAAVSRLKDFIQNRKSKKAAFLYGVTGCGKTSAVYALAAGLGCEILEINASDARNAAAINEIVGSASGHLSLFGGEKVILVDEVDGISGQKDRGGVTALAKIIPSSAFPIIIIANNPWDRKFSSLRKVSEMIEFKPLTSAHVMQVLEKVVVKEDLKVNETSLHSLANRSGGDIRAAINDLQVLAGKSRTISQSDVDTLSDRERTENMLNAIIRILKTLDFGLAVHALDSVEEQPDDWFLWLDENIPSEYTRPRYLSKAYDALSLADVQKGRIRRSQYWRLLMYIKLLLSAGVALAKDEKQDRSTNYKQSSRPLKMWIANTRYNKRKNIAEKIALYTHTSPQRVLQDTLPLLKPLFKTQKGAELAEEFSLDREEVEWLRK